jgi:L-amino acid N-acyltransferase YncA
MIVRAMTPSDWEAVARIFSEGIATGTATFETECPSWEAWDAAHRPDCRLVADDGGVLGFVALKPYSARAVYRGVGELDIYVASAARGRGVGRALLAALIAASEAAGYWTLQASILPGNAASLGLHRSLAFRDVGRRERLGRGADGRWSDVLLLERRVSDP